MFRAVEKDPILDSHAQPGRRCATTVKRKGTSAHSALQSLWVVWRFLQLMLRSLTLHTSTHLNQSEQDILDNHCSNWWQGSVLQIGHRCGGDHDIWQNPESPGSERAAKLNKKTVWARSKAYRSHGGVFSHSLPQGVVMCPPCVCGQEVPVKHLHIQALNLLTPVETIQTSIPDQYPRLFTGLSTSSEIYEIKLKHDAQSSALFTPRNFPILYWGRQFKKSSGAWSH